MLGDLYGRKILLQSAIGRFTSRYSVTTPASRAPSWTASLPTLLREGWAEQDREHNLIATEAGRNIFRQMVARYRSRLAEIVERWSADAHGGTCDADKLRP